MDWHFDNPAGRLHALLSEVNETNTSIISAWATVLGVSEDDATLLMSDAVRLVDEVRAAVSERDSFRWQVELYSPGWRAMAFPQKLALTEHVNAVAVPPESLVALAALGEYLHAVEPEAVPGREHLNSLMHDLHSLIDEVRNSDELPEDVRVVIVKRLYGVIGAIEKVGLCGARGVEDAIDMLAGALAVRDDKSAIVGKVNQAVHAVRNAFTVTQPPRALPPGNEAPPSLPSGE